LPSVRLQARVIDDYDPFASPEEYIERLLRAETRAGDFTGPGWAPTWNVGAMDLQTSAINED